MKQTEQQLNPVLIVLALTFLVWAGSLYLRYRQTGTEARQAFDAARRRREFSEDEAFEPYRDAFLRTSDLRVGIYRLLASISAVISIPVSVTLISFIWARFYYLFGRPAWMTEGELVHSFTLAVFAMLGLVGVAAVFAHRYHKRRPGTFATEWDLAKDRALVPGTSADISPKTN